MRDRAHTAVLIFSCDRALQLDATLRSLQSRCADWGEADVMVIYKARDADAERQYVALREEHRDQARVRFIEEGRFRDDVLEALTPGRSRLARGLRRAAWWARSRLRLPAPVGREGPAPHHVLFLVDDNVFVADFTLREMREAFRAHPDAIGFSLRLGRNTGYCYALDRPQAVPELEAVSERVRRFRWVEGDADFGYPLELSSSLYRVGDVLPVLLRLGFRNPNTLEAGMAAEAGRFAARFPEVLCFDRSVAFCMPINRVQIEYANRAGDAPEHSSAELARLFDAGYRVDVEAYRGHLPGACHEEVDLRLREPSDRSAVGGE